MNKSADNCYVVIDVIEKNSVKARLDKIREKISKPVIIEDKILVKFVLDREFSLFYGNIEWLRSKCSVSLETDEEDGDTAEKSLKDLYSDLQSFNHRFRIYAAEELTSLAND